MDLHGNYQLEPGKLEQIISQFLLKSLHIILDSRIPSLRGQVRGRSGDLTLGGGSRARKSDRWFNLVMGDRPAVLENLNFWHRNVMDPMIIDIILVQQGPSSSVDNLHSGLSGGVHVETVMERWVIQYESSRVMAPPMAPPTSDTSSFYRKTYKKSIILLRSLYSKMRLLPAYRIFRRLSSCSQIYNFDIIYKVSSFCEPFSRVELELMKEDNFVPVDAHSGQLSINVTYRHSFSDFNLEPLTVMPTKIITDYVGSPTTDQLRSYPSEKGISATSFPLRGVQPSVSAPFQRPHSWTSGFHRGAQMMNQPVSGSPPLYRASPTGYYVRSPPTDFYGHRVKSYGPPYQKASYDEYQLSPPFSPSMSPSTPSRMSSGNPARCSNSSETAPVTIPLPMSGRSSRYLSPNFSDPNRHSLPPLSPRSTRHGSSSQESPSGIRLIKKSETSRVGESNSGMTIQYSPHRVLRDSKDDSGRFSGLLSSSGSPRIGFSRSSSRLSFQDDLDDCDFSCPFDVDDVDTPDIYGNQNLDGKQASDSSSRSLSMGRKSQDAAVGVLVHMLRTARPLRQDPSYSSRSFRTSPEEGLATASGFFMPRKTSDALEELRSYREMKDLLLSKSGTHVLRKEET